MSMSENGLEKLAAATGMTKEEAQKKSDAIDNATKMGAEFIITAVESDLGIELTDEQKEKLNSVYKMSFMRTSLFMANMK